MAAKTIKRILYGMMAIAFLAVAGQEGMAAGLTMKAVAAGSAGMLLALVAMSGAG